MILLIKPIIVGVFLIFNISLRDPDDFFIIPKFKYDLNSFDNTFHKRGVFFLSVIKTTFGFFYFSNFFKFSDLKKNTKSSTEETNFLVKNAKNFFVFFYSKRSKWPSISNSSASIPLKLGKIKIFGVV